MRKVNIIRHGDTNLNYKDSVFIINDFEPIFTLKKGYENLGRVKDVNFERFNLDFMFWDETPERKRYFNYGKRQFVSYPFTSAKESFMSLAQSQDVKVFENDLLIVKK